MTGPPSISRKNPEWDKRLVKMLKKANRQIAVGFPKGEAKTTSTPYDTEKRHGPTILQVAIWNNYGTRRIPARPFMQQAVPRVVKEINRILRVVIQELKKRGKTLTTMSFMDVDDLAEILGQKPPKGSHEYAKELDQLFHVIGEAARGELRVTITDGSYVENAPRTRAAKKSDHPLIDKGFLREAVTYVIR